MAKIKLVGGGEATVDDFNFERLNKFVWYKCDRCGHIFRIVDFEGNKQTRYMAADVLGLRGGQCYGACNPCPVPVAQMSGYSFNNPDPKAIRICAGPGCTFGPGGVKHGPSCPEAQKAD